MKKLLLTCTDSMMMQFMIPHVTYLTEQGFQVDLACSDVRNRMDEVRKTFRDNPAVTVQCVDLYRNPFKIGNLKGLGQLRKIVKDGNYDIVWTNEPVMGLMTRLAAARNRKNGQKVMYMAHGFHFFNGAPKRNWCIYYPIEWFMSWFTDLLLVINREDCDCAQKRMKAKKVTYLKGIGIDTQKFRSVSIDRKRFREAIGIPEEDFIYLSVGELEDRKNHAFTIRAFAKMNAPDSNLIIAGTGSQEMQLKELASELNVEDRVHFLGYRRDVGALCKASDVFVFSSRQEGLPVAIMEAMACGLPVVATRIRGTVDEIDDGNGGFLIEQGDTESLVNRMKLLREDRELRRKLGAYNQEKASEFDISLIREQLYEEIQELTGTFA
ncbi:MAG: glycosyltransferase family 4 protein [Lachnospiraceae bacterium]|nr:glycosyltransferase family 4 protein [Lachnospiraceae bacterium]